MNRIVCACAAVALLAVAGVSESKAGLLLGRHGGGMDCNVRAREEGPKQASAENLRETPASTTVLVKPARGAFEAPVQLAKRNKSGVSVADLAKLNSAPVAATVAAK